MRMKNNLGKKSFWYYVRLILLTPLWLAMTSSTKKSWNEFSNGLISHKCDFETEVKYDDEYKWYYKKCKHLGCNVISPCDKTGTKESWE